MGSAERLARTWMASGRDEEVDQMVLDISSGQSKLLDLVKALGEYLTSDEDVLRSKGVDFLSRVIGRCPPDKINRQATRVLVNFYTGKLDDTEAVHPALKGLVPLSTLPTFTSADAIDTVKALFQNVDLMSFPQPTRYLVFQILDSLMAHHREALQGMGDDFIAGYTSLVDGEKDPRNLMIAFSIDRVICIEFDISHHTEKLFNIIFCYFPIAFKPPPNSTIDVTAEDLKLALQSCLNASPLFGRLAIPLFLEKLLAGSPATKKDTLETVDLCLPVYGAGAVGPFGKKLWNSLKLEVFQPVNPELESQSLKAVQTLIRTLYEGTEDSNPNQDDIQGLGRDICKECMDLMGEPEKSQAIPASKVAAALVGTTASISRFVLSQSIPHLMKLFRDPDELVHRPQILTLLCITVSAVSASQSALEKFGLQGLLLSFKDDVLGAFIAGLTVPGGQEAALEGLKRLCEMHEVLSEEEVTYVVHSINEILVGDSEHTGDTSDDVLDVLIAISVTNAKVIEESTLPLLFNSLPDTPPSKDEASVREKYWCTLKWLARLCISAPLFETLVVRLLTKLDIVCAPKADNGSVRDTEARDAYAHNLLKTLASVLEVKVNAKHTDVPKYVNQLVPRLFNLFIYVSIISGSEGGFKLDPRVIQVAGNAITLVVQTLSPERQNKLAQDLHSAFYRGDVKGLATGQHTIPSGVTFKPFESSSSHSDLVWLLASAIIAFDKGVLLRGIDPDDLLSDLQSWSLDRVGFEIQEQAAHYIIASYVNKNTSEVANFIAKQPSEFWGTGIKDASKPVERRKTAIRSYLWVAKALTIQNHASAGVLVDKLFNLFEDADIGWDAAKAIGRIASGREHVLTKQNHAVIRILSAQKYFKLVLPKILENLTGSIQTPRQLASLVALTSLLSALPKTTYASDLPRLMPHLIRGIDLPDVEIRTSTINTLLDVAEAGGATQEYATSLVPVVLRNALPQDLTSQNLRIAALKYLAVLPSVVRYDILHPHKATVLRDLGKALDDPKRRVRRQAVEARTAWFMYRG